jgi:putative ABC transport system permease protein
MKSVTRGNIKMAVASVRTTKARSFLTVFGIIIGVASVITVLAIGEGIQHQVSKQVEQLGKNLITIRAGQVQTASLNSLVNLAGVNTSAGLLSDKDIKAAQKTPDVNLVVPLSYVPGSVHGDHTVSDGLVLGTSGDLPEAVHQSAEFGAFFSEDDEGTNVAVLGAHIAKQLFNDEVPLGQSFTFRGQTFLVRAIMNEFDSAPFSTEVDFNDAIFIPYTTAKDLTNNQATPFEILVRPNALNETTRVESALRKNLLKLHSDPSDFTVLKQSESLAATNSILNLITHLISGVAAISLLVGGIGIMNIMLVSVTERMHEIGIRKAVGATNRQILSQFVIEATVLSLVGALLGIIVAFIVDAVLHIFTNLTPVISWEAVLLATGVSLAVGIIFGTAPALKAARKDPISALRNE